ncbi:hypothetical protein MRB53_032802 [Persea americana]|uniref:Uncharacterized protein n=1 Tax=Persea americana TaxID=3435 RepID=A0ACC2KTY0_PERAE|nr:hypothetical protein MRB53_032802 [Persea americana]
MALLSSINWIAKHIPSVQEHAREPLDAVPKSYVCNVANDPVADRCNPSLQVPLVNMASLVNGGESREEELQKLDLACRQWGAFQLINHGVSEELIKEMKKQTLEFYNLPLEENLRYSHKEGSLEGYGKHFINSQKLQWSDMMFLNALPVEDRNFSFWPKSPQGIRETRDSYTKQMRKLVASLLGFMSMATGLKAYEFSEVCEDGILHLRMNYYPPCPQPDQVIRCSADTDITSISLLLELDDIPGLQIRKDGYWAAVKPIPGAVDVTIGHVTEIMSNGIYKAAEHRAVVNESKVRISIICFCYPEENATIEPVQDIVKPDCPAMYKSISQPEYFHSYLDEKLESKQQFIDTVDTKNVTLPIQHQNLHRAASYHK